MQRHIPLGYCVAQGKAQIDPETCQVVQAIYQAYDNEVEKFNFEHKPRHRLYIRCGVKSLSEQDSRDVFALIDTLSAEIDASRDLRHDKGLILQRAVANSVVQNYADAINDLIGIGGLGDFNVMELQKLLAGKRVSVNASVQNLTERINGGCAPKDFETMLQLTYLTFTAPRMDQEAFESYKTRMKAQLANLEADPNIAFSDTVRKMIYNDNPRVQRLTENKVDSIDYQKVMTLYKDRFKDASDFTFIMVGNIDSATMVPLIEKYLGALPSIQRKESFRDNHIDIQEGVIRNVFHKDLQTPKATVCIVYSGTCDYTLKNKLLISMISQLLTMKYTETVREEAGASYGVSVSESISKYPNVEATLQIYFDTDPEKRAEMVELTDKGIEEFIANGPNENDLQKVKEYMQCSLIGEITVED